MSGLRRDNRAPKAARTAAPSHLRLDIQGLRAVAVGVVILDHLLGFPSGGFIGVDIFFVVSGFLITGLLIREFQRSGTISFRGFYIRRIKRILPVALVVLLLTLLSSWLLLPGQFQNIAWDGLASALFVANWRFAAAGTDYFSQGTGISPLQHFWSLAVEEQFYLLWPWLLLGVLYLVVRIWRRRESTGIRLAGIIIITITVISFGWAIYQSTASPSLAYFSSLTRAWELGIGAILAIFAGALSRVPLMGRIVMNWVGLAGIAASLFLITSSTVFPAPSGALPVLSTALVIAAGTGGAVPHNVLLVNPVSKYLGDISYSLYLWHWPLVVLLGVVFVERSIPYYVTVILATVLLSVGSYHLIERPFQTSPLFTLRGSPPAVRTDAWKAWRTKNATPTRYAAIVTALGLAVVFVTSGVYVQETSIQRDAAAAQQRDAISAQASPTATEKPLPPEEQALQDGLRDALLATTWPALSPSVENILDEAHPHEIDGKEKDCNGNMQTCEFGDPANPELLVYGDSLAITLMPTVIAAYGDRYHIRGIMAAACNVYDLDVKFADAGAEERCLRIRNESVTYINEHKPAAVLVIQHYGWGNQWLSKGSSEQLTAVWKAGASSWISKVAGSGSKIVLVSPPTQQAKSLTACKTATSTPADCISSVPAVWNVVSAAEKQLSGTYYMDTLHWFCYNGSCPSFSGTTPIRRDEHHTTLQYAKQVAPDFARMLDPILSGEEQPTP